MSGKRVWLIAVLCLLFAAAATAQEPAGEGQTETSSPGGEIGQPGAGESAPSPPGDPRHGEALYIGAASFSNGGAPCLACHGIAGHGLAGGASFGPDLTAGYASYGDELVPLLADMPFPSMAPIYAERPLVPQESADLVAFLAEVSGETPQVAGPFVLKGAIGAAALFAIILAFGWRRLRGVRGPLVEETRREFGGERR